LPQPLKELAIERLTAVGNKVKDFDFVKRNPILLGITLRQIQDNINYLKARDQNDKWNDFLKFNRKLDATRRQGPIENIVPEFKPYV
jgi:hypothetical protein